MPSHLFSETWAELAGTVVVGLLWQGTLIGVLVAAALAATRKRSPNLRYALACVGLLLIAALLPANFAWLATRDTSVSPSAATQAAADSSPALATPEPAFSPSDPSDPSDSSTPDRPPRPQLTATQWYHLSLPWLGRLWAVGIICFALYDLAGLFALRRLRAKSQAVGEDIAALAHRVQERLGVRVRVQVRWLAGISSALVTGFFRTVILLPASMATRMTPDEIEAILAHEFAHIHRWDLWVNAFQRVVEALLFFHPVVWWLSKTIRAERELCCDELALRAYPNRAQYVRALLTLAETTQQTQALALSSHGGSLVNRVRQILGGANVDRLSVRGRMLAALLAVCSIALPFLLAAATLDPKAILDEYDKSLDTISVWRMKGVENIQVEGDAPGANSDTKPSDLEYYRDGERRDVRKGSTASGQRRIGEDRTVVAWVAHGSSDLAHMADAFGSDAEARSEVVALLGCAATLEGYFALDKRRVCDLLREAPDLRRRPESETVHGMECVVIEGSPSQHGDYTLWLAPKLGYQIVKAHIMKSGDDYFRGKPMSQPQDSWSRDHLYGDLSSIDCEVEITDFQEVDAVQLPTHVEWRMKLAYTNGTAATMRRTFERTETDLSPDLTKQPLFKSAIPEGTPILVRSDPRHKYIWHEGKPAVLHNEDETRALFEAFLMSERSLTMLPGNMDLGWKDIPTLLKLAEDTSLVDTKNRTFGRMLLTEVPAQPFTGDPQSWAVRGMISLWMIEGIRCGYGASFRPPLYGFCFKDDLTQAQCEASDTIHKETLAAYQKWWDDVRELPIEEAAVIDPLLGTGLRWCVPQQPRPPTAASSQPVPRPDAAVPASPITGLPEPPFTIEEVAAYHREKTGTDLPIDKIKQLYTNIVLHDYGKGGDISGIKDDARRALAFEQDELTRLQLYLGLSDGYYVQPDIPWQTQRKNLAKVMLVGLREILQNDLPDDPPDVPGVGRFEIGGSGEVNDPVREEAERKHAAQMAAHEKAKRIAELVRSRIFFTQSLISEYNYRERSPAAYEELYTLALEYLGDETAAQQLREAAESYQGSKSPVPVLRLPDAHHIEAPKESGALNMEYFALAHLVLPKDSSPTQQREVLESVTDYQQIASTEMGKSRYACRFVIPSGVWDQVIEGVRASGTSVSTYTDEESVPFDELFPKQESWWKDSEGNPVTLEWWNPESIDTPKRIGWQEHWPDTPRKWVMALYGQDDTGNTLVYVRAQTD